MEEENGFENFSRMKIKTNCKEIFLQNSWREFKFLSIKMETNKFFAGRNWQKNIKRKNVLRKKTEEKLIRVNRNESKKKECSQSENVCVHPK